MSSSERLDPFPSPSPRRPGATTSSGKPRGRPLFEDKTSYVPANLRAFRAVMTVLALALWAGLLALSYVSIDRSMEERRDYGNYSLYFLIVLFPFEVVWLLVEATDEALSKARYHGAEGEEERDHALITPRRPRYSNIGWLFPLSYLACFSIVYFLRWASQAEEYLGIEAFVETEWNQFSTATALTVIPLFCVPFYLTFDRRDPSSSPARGERPLSWRTPSRP